MRRRLGFWLSTLLLPLLLLPPSAAAARYRIDNHHSQAGFSVRLLWLREVEGRFARLDATLQPGPQADTLVVAARIMVDSVAMESPRLRRWVLAPEFFDAAQYPTIRFVSAPMPHLELERGGELPGWLTLRGVTRPVRFVLQPMRCDSARPATCQVGLNGSVQRSDFGMNGHRATLSDRVKLNLVIVLSSVPP